MKPQTFDLPIKGEMMGRNGYTKLGRVTACTYQDGAVRVDFCSPRAGVIGAAAIELDAEQFAELTRFFQRVNASI